MTVELNQEQAMLVLQALDRLNISKYAYPEEHKVANMLMAKLHKELRIMEQEQVEQIDCVGDCNLGLPCQTCGSSGQYIGTING